MSSTNRGGDRHASDYYVTPQQDINMFLSEWLLDEGIDRPDKLVWLDPCAGGDKRNPAAYPTALEEAFDPYVVTYDIREDAVADRVCDYLQLDAQDMEPCDVVISNPPFSHAEEFIEQALMNVTPGGVCRVSAAAQLSRYRQAESVFREVRNAEIHLRAPGPYQLHRRQQSGQYRVRALCLAERRALRVRQDEEPRRVHKGTAQSLCGGQAGALVSQHNTEHGTRNTRA